MPREEMWLHAPEGPRRPRPCWSRDFQPGAGKDNSSQYRLASIEWEDRRVWIPRGTWVGWLSGSVEIRMAVLSFPAMGWARGSLRHRQPSTRRAMGLIAVSRVWLRTSVSGTIWSAP